MKIVITGRNFDEKAKQVLKGNEIVDYSYLNLGPGADPNHEAVFKLPKLLFVDPNPSMRRSWMPVPIYK